MSIAEPLSPAARKLEPYQKWYLLFPVNWAQLAFDCNWRTKRLTTLCADQNSQGIRFYIIGGLVFLIIMCSMGNSWSSDANTPPRSLVGSVNLAVNMVLVFVFQAVTYLKHEFERILLQIIDRLETEDVHHA